MFCQPAQFQKISQAKNSRRSAHLHRQALWRSRTTVIAFKITKSCGAPSNMRAWLALPVLDHCQDYNLVGNGVVHEGYWSTLLGLPGWPAAGEEAIVMRNILLAELCDHPIHCQHHHDSRKCAVAS